MTKKITADAAPAKRVPVINCQLAEFSRQMHHVKAQPDHSPEDAVRPEYLWHYYRQLTIGDRVEVHGPKREWMVELLVDEIDQIGQGVICRLIATHDWRETVRATVSYDLATVEMKGNRNKWCVMLDGKIVKSGFETETDALGWVDERRPSKAA